MKLLKKLFLALLVIIILAVLAAWFFLKSMEPKYEGTIELEGLSEPVDVYFDEYGIPHIYAQNAEDAYFALGYVHAQGRLFQMEMIRKLTSGRMAEILGPDLVETDRFFRTLGLRDIAEKSAATHFTGSSEPYEVEALAYLAGLNHYQDTRESPLEFTILGMEKEPFTPADIYTTYSYMALSFTGALKEEPILTKIRDELGADYIKDWWVNSATQSDTFLNNSVRTQEGLSHVSGAGKDVWRSLSVSRILEELAMPLWNGSNGWVLSPQKTKSGKVLFANDTHIQFSQPSVWYEAHMEYPGFSFYGNYLATTPFGAIGTNKDIAWGMTIYPIDNFDLYREKLNPENPDEVWEDDHWAPLQNRREIIKVRGGEDVIYDVKISRHGPILNEGVVELNSQTDPIALWWIMLQGPSDFLQASYNLIHAKGIDDARRSAAMVDILGLNLMYGDAEGNIAWWASGKIPKRPDHVHSKFILDGASGKDEPMGFYDFSENYSEENPPSGMVASANHEPGLVNGISYPGYYLPDNRFKRIKAMLASRNDWTLEEMKALQADVKSDIHSGLANLIAGELTKSGLFEGKSSEYGLALELLKKWDGNYQKSSSGPVVYSKLIYHIMKETQEDEMGAEDFDAIVPSFIFKKSIPKIVANEGSAWWDNVTTKEKKESRLDIFAKAFETTVSELTGQLGADTKNWQWQDVHTLTHAHPLGRMKPLDRFFNVGPFSAPGGNGVPNKMEYILNGEGRYDVISGPALRILLDFADPENSISINPTGQSGNVMSKHYDDQAEMFVEGVYRKQMMNKEEIVAKGRLLKLE